MYEVETNATNLNNERRYPYGFQFGWRHRRSLGTPQL